MTILLMGLVGFSSCQSEDEMEERILEGYCWEGYLPIYNYGNDYYSRFFFDTNGTGIEEVYINGRFDNEYPFTWGWMNDSYAVLRLKYRSRWHQYSYSCIDVIEVKHNKLKGYFYENMDDYYYDYDHNFENREDLYFTLRTTGDHRYH